MSTSWGCFSWSVLCHQYLFTCACPAVAPMALPLNTKEPCQRILEMAQGTRSLGQSFAGKRFCRKEFVPFVRHELGSVLFNTLHAVEARWRMSKHQVIAAKWVCHKDFWVHTKDAKNMQWSHVAQVSSVDLLAAISGNNMHVVGKDWDTPVLQHDNELVKHAKKACAQQAHQKDCVVSPSCCILSQTT